jgi:glutaminase
MRRLGRAFSVQSIAKVFALALAVDQAGAL